MTEHERRQLNRLVAKVAADAGCVGCDTVDRLARQCGAGVAEDDVRAALAREDVVVADLPDLPTRPPRALSRLLDSVAELRLQLSIEVVFGSALTYGFRLLGGVRLDDGRRLDRQSLDDAALQVERLPDGTDRILRQTIIAELTEAAAEEGALDAIVLWEVLIRLRRYLDDSFSQRALAQQARALWLVHQDAEQLGAALVAEFTSGKALRTPAPHPIPNDAPAVPPEQPAPTPQPVIELQGRAESGRGGDTPAVGPAGGVSAAAPVRNLSALRFQEEVRLRWIWPDNATAALVTWRPEAGHREPTGGRLCSLRAYLGEGGFSATIGHTAMVVEVRAVYGDPHGRARSPATEITVPALGVPVRYRIRRPAWTFPAPLGPRRYTVELAAAYPCELPDLVVVESRIRTQPSTPHQGEPVARVERRMLAAGEPVCVEVRLDPPGPSWLQCFVDPDRHSEDEVGIVLQPPPVHEQRVR
ncbi:MAG: hypothetical protein ACRDTH_20800 [Pseudonocardiaceae bacterium]